MEDLEYIKNFSKISITDACKKNKINRSNVLNGKASKNKIKKVRKQLENDVAMLYLMRDENEERKDSL